MSIEQRTGENSKYILHRMILVEPPSLLLALWRQNAARCVRVRGISTSTFQRGHQTARLPRADGIYFTRIHVFIDSALT